MPGNWCKRAKAGSNPDLCGFARYWYSNSSTLVRPVQTEVRTFRHYKAVQSLFLHHGRGTDTCGRGQCTTVSSLEPNDGLASGIKEAM